MAVNYATDRPDMVPAAEDLITAIDMLISEWRTMNNIPTDADVEWSAQITDTQMTLRFGT